MEFVIPEELLANILVRLPFKDILRFKFVCKSWLKLISSSDPYFTSNYVRNSPFTLLFHATDCYNKVPDKLSLSLVEFAKKGGDRECTQIPLLTPKIPDLQGSGSRLSFIGSCNCSVFILHCKPFKNYLINRVYSFNPVLGSRVVKFVADDITGKRERWRYKVGFIPSNNTYKLLRLYPSFKQAEKAEIFTVGRLDENWRKVDDHPLLFGDDWSYDGLICFNGAYHWLSKREYDNDMIFTFDLLEERMGAVIPIPRGVLRSNAKLLILDGHLSLVHLFLDDFPTMVVWAMKEYGVVESWSRVFMLSEKSRYDNGLLCSFFRLVPISVLANGDILFYDTTINGGMWFYNLQQKRFRWIEHPCSSDSHRIYENTYVPRFYT